MNVYFICSLSLWQTVRGYLNYSFDKICTLTSMDIDNYIVARNALIDKELIAFDLGGLKFCILGNFISPIFGPMDPAALSANRPGSP